LPVAPPETLEKVGEYADELPCCHADADFRAVGQFYRNVGQVEDEEAIALLAHD